MVGTRRLDRRTLRALAFAGVAALLWAAIEGIGATMLVGYDPLQVVWVRYAVHLLALIAIVGPRLGLGLVRTTRPAVQVGRGLLMLLMPLAFLSGAAVAPATTILALFWCAPLLALALAALIVRERPGRWRWVAALSGWLGALLIIRPGAGALRPAALPAFGMAGCFALYLVLTRQLRDQGTAVNLFYTAACVLVPLSVALPRFWRAPSARALATMIAIGLLGLGFLYALDRAADLAPIGIIAPVFWTQPVWSLALVAAVGGHWPGRAALLGVILIVAAVALLARPQREASGFAARLAVVGGAAPALTARATWYRWLLATLVGGKR